MVTGPFGRKCGGNHCIVFWLWCCKALPQGEPALSQCMRSGPESWLRSGNEARDCGFSWRPDLSILLGLSLSLLIILYSILVGSLTILPLGIHMKCVYAISIDHFESGFPGCIPTCSPFWIVISSLSMVSKWNLFAFLLRVLYCCWGAQFCNSLLVLNASEPHLNFWIFQWCWWPLTWCFLIALARGMLPALSRHVVSWWILWFYIIVLLISTFTVCHRNLGIHFMWKAIPSVYLSQLKNLFPWYWIERQWVSLLVKKFSLK